MMAQYQYISYLHPKGTAIDNLRGASEFSVYVQGRIGVKESLVKLRQNVFRLLSTEMGEIFYNPRYGVPLRWLLFEPNLPEYLKPEVRTIILTALRYWEPRVQLRSVEMERRTSNGVNDTLRVFLEFVAVELQQVFSLEVQR